MGTHVGAVPLTVWLGTRHKQTHTSLKCGNRGIYSHAICSSACSFDEMFYFSLCIYKLYSQKQATQCMQTKAACKPWLHANHGWPTLIPYDVRIISDGLNRAENTQIWWGWVKIGEKWSTNEKLGLIFWGKVQDGIRSMPLYRCFQRANFDTPHGHHEFRMQFWPTRTDSHAVSHFKELCCKGGSLGASIASCWREPSVCCCIIFRCLRLPSRSCSLQGLVS